MTREEIIARSDEGIAAWNAHDPAAIGSLFAPDGSVRDAPSMDEPALGRGAIAQRAVDLINAFPDCRLTRTSIMVEGDRACTEWRFEGTHQGEIFGVPATGRQLTTKGCSVERFGPDGLITEETAYWDLATFLRQTGALQPTAAARATQA